jgi:putative PIN family toxin of toxin-antitoxin system
VDSNILVCAVMSPGGPALRLLDMVLDAHTLILSRFILDEVERVLLYPRIQARYRITLEEATRFTASLAEASHLVEPKVIEPLAASDPMTMLSSTLLPTGTPTCCAPGTYAIFRRRP